VLLITGCDSFSGSNQREPYEAETPPPTINLESRCDTTDSGNGKLVAAVKNANTFAVLDAAGDTVRTDAVDSDTIKVAGLPNGDYHFAAANDVKAATESATLNCETIPVQPGLSKNQECVAEDGEITVTAENGFDSFEFVYLKTGDTIAEDSGLEAEKNQQFREDNLDDGDYRFDATLQGEEESLDASFSCDEDSPGNISIDKSCVNEQGEVTATVENGAESWELYRDGELIDGEDGLTPEENQEISLNDLEDGDFEIKVYLNDKESSKSFTVDCDVPGPGEIDVQSECQNEDGKFTVSSDNGFEVARVFDSGGNLVEEKTGFDPSDDPEAVFDGLADGDYDIEVERNGKVRSTEKSVDCDVPGPQAPSLVSQKCSDEFNGILTFGVDSKADTYELHEVGSGNTVREGDINGRSELELSGIPDGQFKLVIIRNGKSAASDPVEVDCDLRSRSCLYTFSGDNMVDGFAKNLKEDLANPKTVLEFEPETTPRIRADIRLSQGEQEEFERYALGFVTPEGDTLFTQVRPDQDDSGSAERWLTDSFQISDELAGQLEVGVAYKLVAVHGSYIDGVGRGRFGSVFFSTDDRDGRIEVVYEYAPPGN